MGIPIPITSIDNSVIGIENKVVYVSIIRIEKTINILATADKKLFERDEYLQPQSRDKEICDPCEWDLRINHDYENGRELLIGNQHVIPGNEVLDHLKNIVKKVLELAEKLLNDNPEIIYFSPCTDWTNFPWQYLFYMLAKSQRKKHWPIISIVPSLDWIEVAASQAPPKQCLKSCISQSKDLKEYVDKLKRIYPYNRENVRADNGETSASQYIVFGHGQPPTLKTPFATIIAPKSPIPIDHWIGDKAHGFDGYILHACSSAQVIPLFIGNDFGGLPGLILALRGKIVLAPSIEIHPNASLTLQFEIFEQMLHIESTYADAYRAAIQKDERCLFYTLFGLATLPLRVYHRRSSR